MHFPEQENHWCGFLKIQSQGALLGLDSEISVSSIFSGCLYNVSAFGRSPAKSPSFCFNNLQWWTSSSLIPYLENCDLWKLLIMNWKSLASFCCFTPFLSVLPLSLPKRRDCTNQRGVDFTKITLTWLSFRGFLIVPIIFRKYSRYTRVFF